MTSPMTLDEGERQFVKYLWRTKPKAIYLFAGSQLISLMYQYNLSQRAVIIKNCSLRSVKIVNVSLITLGYDLCDKWTVIS